MKQNDKLRKKLGEETFTAICNMSSEALQKQIVLSEQSMQSAKDELEANPKYQELKESLKALTAGLREVNARQRAIIQQCLLTLGDVS